MDLLQQLLELIGQIFVGIGEFMQGRDLAVIWPKIGLIILLWVAYILKNLKDGAGGFIGDVVNDIPGMLMIFLILLTAAGSVWALGILILATIYTFNQTSGKSFGGRFYAAGITASRVGSEGTLLALCILVTWGVVTFNLPPFEFTFSFPGWTR